MIRVTVGLFAFGLAALPCLVLFFRAWPEMVTTAYLMTKGWRLYDAVVVPETPLVLGALSLLGSALGFTTALLRGVAAANAGVVGLVATWALLRHRGRRGPGIPTSLLVAITTPLLFFYTEAVCVWFDPFVAPLLLGGALLLERFERLGRRRDLLLGGAVFGMAVLVKQTSAWALLAAALWLMLASRRRSRRRLAVLLACGSLPYAAFAGVWAVAFGTLAHIRWTFVIPVFGGFGADVGRLPTSSDLLAAIPLFLPLLAVALLAQGLPVRNRLRSPLPWIALGVVGMAFPRWGLVHLSGAVGICAVLTGRAGRVAWTLVSRRRRRRTTPLRLAAFSAGTATLVVQLAVLVGVAKLLLPDAFGGTTWYWDDPNTRARAAQVAAHVPPGGRFLNYLATWDNVYVLTDTTPPTHVWANPSFWYILDRDHVGSRMLDELQRLSGASVFFRAPNVDERRIVASNFYRGLLACTRVTAKVDTVVSWREIVGGNRDDHGGSPNEGTVSHGGPGFPPHKRTGHAIPHAGLSNVPR